MYRYTLQQTKSEDPARQRRRHLVKNVIIIVLLAVIIAGAFYTLPAVNYRNEAAVTYRQRITSECASALSLANTLSRTAGASSWSTLAAIRSRIYAMETLNELHSGMGDGMIIQTSWFTTLYGILDDYTNKLTTGTNTSDQVSNLQNNLQILNDQLNAL